MRTPYGLKIVEDCRNCQLHSKSFFCDFSPPTMKAFNAIKFPAAYPEGAVLFVEGEPARGILVVCQGRVKLSMTSSDGKTVILRIVRPGEVLGLHATLSDKPYQATAETLEPCQLNFVKRDDFLCFMREHAEASIRAVQQLNNHYQAACERVRTLGLSYSAPARLARFLLESSTNGQETKRGIRVKFTLTHEEIAQLIGTSRETVTRTLGEFKNQELASLHGSTLLIQNKQALEGFVGTW